MSLQKVSFTIPGEPMAKQRPEFNSLYKRAYTPTKTANYESYISWLYASECKGVRLNRPVKADITAYFVTPKNMPQYQHKQVKEDTRRPTKAPDTDNLAKSVLDSLNGIAYHDDSHIVELNVQKRWSKDNPRVEVTLEELDMNRMNDGTAEEL